MAQVRERFALLERHACRLLGNGRSTLRYHGRGRTDDRPLRQRLLELVSEQPQFDYRGLHMLRGREGIAVNHKRVERLYRAVSLAVRRRGRKRLARNGRGQAALPVSGLGVFGYCGGRLHVQTDRHRKARVYCYRGRQGPTCAQHSVVLIGLEHQLAA